MKRKKASKVDLEKRRLVFIMIGLSIALLAVYLVLEWNSPRKEVQKVKYAMDDAPEVETVITKREKPKPLPPPPSKKIVKDIIEVTTQKIKVEDQAMVNTETDSNESIKIQKIEPDEESFDDEKKVFRHVEQMPQFPGGDKALLKYISRNIKYPQVAADNGVQGKVYLKFVIEKDGSIGEILIVKSPDKSLSKEAKRVVASLPKFKPGMQNGHPARVWYLVPVQFRLQ